MSILGEHVNTDETLRQPTTSLTAAQSAIPYEATNQLARARQGGGCRDRYLVAGSVRASITLGDIAYLRDFFFGGSHLKNQFFFG